MDKQELPELLEQIKSQLEQIEHVDAKGRAMLREIDADIHDLLARPGSDAPVQASQATLRGLEDSIAHLEATHPALTSLLSRLLETLSNAGI